MICSKPRICAAAVNQRLVGLNAPTTYLRPNRLGLQNIHENLIKWQQILVVRPDVAMSRGSSGFPRTLSERRIFRGRRD